MIDPEFPPIIDEPTPPPAIPYPGEKLGLDGHPVPRAVHPEYGNDREENHGTAT